MKRYARQHNGQNRQRHTARRLQRERQPACMFAALMRSGAHQTREMLVAHARDVAIATALALLVALGIGAGVFGLSHTSTANAHAQVTQHTRRWALTLATDGAAATPRWVDPAHKTALTLHALKTGIQVFVTTGTGGLTLAGQTPYIFALTLPDGSQIVGVALGQPDASGSLLLSTNTLVYDPATGQMTPTAVNTASICDSGVLIGASTRAPIIYALRARFSPDSLSAYAELAYAASTRQIFTAQVGPFASAVGACQGTASLATLPNAVVLDSGCPALAADGSAPGACVDALGTAQQAVSTYDQAVIAQNWAQVYTLSAADITGQYNAGQLAAALHEQTSSVGRITAITMPTSAPAVQFTVGGEAFFAVDQRVTLAQNGATTSRSITSYYIFEGGQWLFWFSK
ncbi:MAG: hypothetical protein ABI068_11730 [Ktedonobacterales bacterium]